MSEPSLEVSERARALRNPAKTGPLVYYPSGWGTGHTERSAGPTMVGPADRSQPPPWSARLSFPAFSFPFLRSFLSSSFPSLPFLSLPPPPGHCLRAPATCTHGHCLRAPATCTVRDTVANGTCHRDTRGLSRACGALPSGGGYVQAQGRTCETEVPQGVPQW